jgi:hypothetical protein
MSWHHNRDRLKQATDEVTFLQHAVMDYKVNIKLDFTINRCVRTIRLLLDAEQKIKGRGRFPDLQLGSQSGIGLWPGQKPQVVTERSHRNGAACQQPGFRAAPSGDVSLLTAFHRTINCTRYSSTHA